MQLYTGPNMFVAYCTKTDSSPCDFYKMTLVAAFSFLMALSELRAPPLPQPSKFSRFKVLLTSYQASRSRSHQQAKQRLAASKGHIEGRRRREGQRWAKQDDGLSLVSTHHHLPPLYTTSDFNAILGGGGRRWWYGLRGCHRVSGSRPPPRWRRARQWFRWRCLALLACLSALKDFTSPCFSFSSSWFLFWFLVGNGGCYVRGCFLFAASRVHMAAGYPGSWHHRRRQCRALHLRHGGGLELLREQRRRRRRRPRLLSRRGRALVGGEAFVGCCWCSAIFCNICSLTMSIFILIHTCTGSSINDVNKS